MIGTTEFIQILNRGETFQAFKIGTIASSYSSGNPRIRFDGESTTSIKGYPYLDTYRPTPNDRVLLAKVGATYVILGPLTIDSIDNLVASQTVANTTTETLLLTDAMPAGSLIPGRVLRTIAMGTYSTANASATLIIRLKMGGITLLETSSTAGNATEAPWKVELTTTIRTTGASGTEVSYISATFNNSEDDAAETVEHSIDTTIAEDITLTVQWDEANAGNTITITQGFVEFLGK